MATSLPFAASSLARRAACTARWLISRTCASRPTVSRVSRDVAKVLVVIISAPASMYSSWTCWTTSVWSRLPIADHAPLALDRPFRSSCVEVGPSRITTSPRARRSNKPVMIGLAM